MSKRVPTLVAKHMRHGTEQGLMVLGVDLRDAKEEVFVRMVTDGISMGVAFARAGFKAKSTEAPYRLWQLDRIQERAAAILEARRTTGVVTLPQVTSMLQRVFSSAFHEGEFNAAHNASLSLARLYGHVNDRQTLEVIRRPSRDPDAPSETALGDWIAELPAINAPAPDAMQNTASNLALRSAPASVLAQSPPTTPDLAEPRDNLAEPQDNPAEPIDWNASQMLPTSSVSRSMSNDINDLPVNSRSDTLNSIESASDPIAYDTIGDVPGRSENGAPAGPVTGTPNQRAHSAPLAERAHNTGDTGRTHAPIPHHTRYTRPPSAIPPLKKKKVPRQKKRVPASRGLDRSPPKAGEGPVKKREFPKAEDLF